MLNKLFQYIIEYYDNQDPNEWLKKSEDIFIQLNFDGNKNLAIDKIKSLKEKSNSDVEFNDLFYKEFNLYAWEFLLSDLNRFSNFKEIILLFNELLENETELITNKENLSKVVKASKELKSQDFFMQNLLDIFKNEEEISKKLKIDFLYTNKSHIAEEFEITIKTLNKWLNIVGLGEKYKGRRKISFTEYIEIFAKFFITGNEDLEIRKRLVIFKKRIKKGMKYRKTDISYLTESDLKTQKANLSKYQFYNFTDVFPYSISKILIEKMGDEIDF